jgi:hypothetical protein
MTILIIGPHHGPTREVRPIYDSFPGNVDPFAIDANPIVTILAFPIGVIDALGICAVTAWALAAVQALIPMVQLGVPRIVSAGGPECKN